MFLKVEYALVAPVRISKNLPIDQLLESLDEVKD